MNPFEQHRDAFVRAHYNTSFQPDKRAEQCIHEFGEELASDLASLPSPGNYERKYIDRVLLWAARKSRTASAMITGPANFPTARNRKALDSEQRAWDEFRSWRSRYIKAANRKPLLSPEDDLEAAHDELIKAEAEHALRLEARKITRKPQETEEEIKAVYRELFEIGMGEEAKFHARHGYWAIFNDISAAKIRRLKEKIEVMKHRIERKTAFEPIQFDGGEITIKNDRVLIRHGSKPEREMIEALKGRGFRWSPRAGAWSRKHTENAIWAAKALVGWKEDTE